MAHQYFKALLFLGLFIPATLQAQKPIKNVIGLSPVQIMNNYVGFSLNYEHFLDKNAQVSINLPSGIGFEMISQNYNYSSGMRSQKVNSSVFFNPGVKYYPAGNRKFFTYALGLSLFMQAGECYNLNNYGVYNHFPDESYDFFTGGVLVNNYLDFKVNKALSIGIEVGVGPSYINRFSPESNNELRVNGRMIAFPNIATQIKYRF